ncbi:transposase [Agrobacterium sp. T29]|uniref:transposase n=1 Tax=Agrobacterium sp. T29 TaxID=2580515 RepID=UPI00352F52E2
MIMDENGTGAWAALARHVDPIALLIADERKEYDDLVLCFHAPREPQPPISIGRRHELKRNRELIRSCRESLQGINHRVSTKYLDWYLLARAVCSLSASSTNSTSKENCFAMSAVNDGCSRCIKMSRTTWRLFTLEELGDAPAR